MPHAFEIIATVLFALAIIHTFIAKFFEHAAHRFEKGSAMASLLHLLGEVEVVFGIWAGLFFLCLVFGIGYSGAVDYLESLNFTEPLFVFTVMAISATRPVLQFARRLMHFFQIGQPSMQVKSLYVATLIIGPLLGSFITEPAAMTVTALMLREQIFSAAVSNRVRYITLGTLFVNVSIGGTLSHFAAPPVLMVAGKWGWGFTFMALHFGWKSMVAVTLNALVAVWSCRHELKSLADAPTRSPQQNSPAIPIWVTGTHLIFLGLVVTTAHHMVLFSALFLFFLGLTTITRRYQDVLKLRESLLVAFFLGGLVVLGKPQHWWLQPLLEKLGELPLFLGATALTAITDNAALTYLGSQVEGLTFELKYALLAGAVAGGGLTVIANAPNPAGYAILNSTFGDDGVQPGKLFVYALVPTLVGILALWFLPH